jgi:hypothetical protein
LSIQVQRRREAWSFVKTFIGAVGELIVDTTDWRVTVHDGTTAGGWPMAKAGRRNLGDANGTILITDSFVCHAALTATRTDMLPAAASYPVGQALIVADESDNASATVEILVQCAGSDTFINGATEVAIRSGGGSLAFFSNGVNKWVVR